MRGFIYAAFVWGFATTPLYADDWPSNAMTPRICTQAQRGAPGPQSFNGDISFSPAEKNLHLQKLTELLKHSSDCVERALNYREVFSSKPGNLGLDPYYGSWFDGDLIEELQIITGSAENLTLREVSKRLIPVSCVGLAVKCLETGFNSAGLASIWEKVHKFRCANDTSGMALQYALRELGWQTWYWSYSGDLRIDQQLRKVNGKWVYGQQKLPVDNISAMARTSAGLPAAYKSVPLSIMTANDGYHVFLGLNRGGSNFRAIEGSASGAPSLASGPAAGQHFALDDTTPGPAAAGNYGSGVAVVPPGY